MLKKIEPCCFLSRLSRNAWSAFLLCCQYRAFTRSVDTLDVCTLLDRRKKATGLRDKVGTL
ncbi:MAG: hypothetical protein ABRQ27_01710 [Clostridiaceae bacterium]